MTRRARNLLLALLLLGAGTFLVVLGTVPGGVPGEGPAVSTGTAPAPAPVPLPTADDVAALASLVGRRHPELGARAGPALHWWFDRLAEALRQAEGRLSPGAGRPSDAEGSALVKALEDLAPDAEALMALVAALTHRSGPAGPDVGSEASLALSQFPPTEARQLQHVYAQARDPRLRRGLVAAGARMRPATAEVLSFLEAAADDVQPWVQTEAFRGLGALGPRAVRSLPRLRAHLSSDLEATRLPAAAAVLRIAAPDEAAHGVLQRHLASVDPFDRGEAIALLVTLGAPGRGVWPDLIPLLADDRRTALVMPEQTVAPDRVSWAAAEALVALNARGLAGRLREVVAGDDARARVGAGLTLLGLGIQFPEAPQVLVEALELEEDSNWLEWKRLEVIQGALDPELADDVLLDALVERLHGLHGKASAVALLGLGEAGRARVRSILATTGKDRAYERHAVLLALLDDPSRAEGFAAELKQMAEKDSNSWNRATARDLLDR